MKFRCGRQKCDLQGGTRLTWLGIVEAVDPDEAVEKAADEFKVIASKLFKSMLHELGMSA